MPCYLFSKESSELLIYLAYISIILRIIPVSLQWISMKRKNLGAQFFFLLSLLSFLADVFGVISNITKTNTDFIFNLYQISEVVIITLLAVQFGHFDKKFRNTLFIACLIQLIFFISLLSPTYFDSSQDYINAITKLFILAILFISATRYIQKAESTHKIDIAPLIGLLGVFIFEALSIIPFISLQLQRLSGNPQQITIIYLILVIAGNLIRDVLVSYNAILNLKKSP